MGALASAACRCLRRLWRHYRYPLLLAITSRLALLLCLYLGLVLVPLASPQGVWRSLPDNLFLDGLARWDSGWYLGIGEHGYNNAANAEGQRDTAFFPAYPLLLSLASGLGGEAMVVWGIALSNLLFALGLCLLYDLARHSSTRRQARLAVACAAFGPFSIFFSAVYTESLFFALSTGAFWLAQRNRLFGAMAAAALASLTKVVGILVVPFAILTVLAPGASAGLPPTPAPSRPRPSCLHLVVAAGAGCSLLLLHLLYQQQHFGSMVQFVLSQRGWAAQASPDKLREIWAPLLDGSRILRGDFYGIGVINSASLLAAGLLILLGLRRRWLPAPQLLWALLTLGVSSSLWPSGGRFVTALFPLYPLVARLCRRLPAEAVVGSSALLMALFAFLFSHWHWLA